MEITDKINYVLGKTVVYMLLIIYPFVMHNKLNDVTLTRFFFFIIVSYVGFLVLCINSLASFILKRVSDKKKYDDDNVDFINIQEGAYSAESQSISKVYDIKDKIKNMDLWKKLIFLFLFVCIMSYLFSPYKSVAFLGHGGRYTGLVFYGACVCMYYVVSTCYRFEKRDITYVLCSTILVNVWAVLNYAGMDPFYIYKDVPAAMKTVYISSLGNIDIYGMYVNMMLALAMFSFVYEESTAGKLFYGICALLGMMGSLASDSDMAVAGMFFAFVILIYFAISDYNRLIRYFMLAVELFIAGRILGVIYIFNQFNTRIIKSVGSIIVYKNVFVVFPVVCFIAIFIIQLLHDKCDLFANKKLIDKIKKIYVIICVVFAAVACLMVIICTAVQRGPLAITDDWGSGRGYIWKNSLDGFKNLPFINKIFGAGEASTAWVLSDYSAAANNIFNRGRVDNAHNIWINMLITLGIAGLIVYVLLLVEAISNIKRHLKGSSEACHMNKSRYMLAGAGLAVMVYSIQGTAEMLEVITFPIFFCLLAMLNCSTKNKNTEKQELNKKETDI